MRPARVKDSSPGELLLLPGTYGPCPICHGSRYNDETLEVTYRGMDIAPVLSMTVAHQR